MLRNERVLEMVREMMLYTDPTHKDGHPGDQMRVSLLAAYEVYVMCSNGQIQGDVLGAALDPVGDAILCHTAQGVIQYLLDAGADTCLAEGERGLLDALRAEGFE